MCATLLLLASCTDTEISPNQNLTSPEIAPSASDSQPLDVPEGATPHGVVLAAFILSNGDITRAVEEGLVTPIEVELARTAIQDGILQQWVDLAD